jgi:VWA domain-containing protein
VDTAITLTVSQHRFLAADAGAQDLHAVAAVRVSGADGAAEPGEPALAEVLVVDCSRSMRENDHRKFRAAKKATLAALRLLPDGTPFAVVAGNHEAVTAYPPGGGRLAIAGPATRAEAEIAVGRMLAAGGTCVGRWLDLCHDLLATRPAGIRHVLMLTDGRNEHDHFRPLAEALPGYRGSFVCDAWGYGTDWDAQLLLRVTGALHGRADAVRAESELAAAYERRVHDLLAKTVPELTLTVEPAPEVRLRYVRQSHPTDAPMTPEDDRPAEYVTRAWGNEQRTYHLCLAVDPEGAVRGEDLLVAEVGVRVPAGSGFTPPDPQAVRVHWTDDPLLPGLSDGLVTHTQRWREIGEAVVAAADAHHAGQHEQATVLLRQAVVLAHQIGARGQLEELARVVEIHDAAAGHVSLRPGLEPVDFQHLITASSHTTPSPAPGDPPLPAGFLVPGTPTASCPRCTAAFPVGARFCGTCQLPLETS